MKIPHSCAFLTFHAFSLFRDSTGDRRFYKTVERPRRNSVPWFLRLEFYFQNLYFSCEWKNISQTHRIVASDDEMSVWNIFSAHKKYFHVMMMNTHHMCTWKLFYNTWCVHLVIVTPVMSRSQFLHPGGGVQKWHQNTPRPRRSRGGSENHPPNRPPPGGWRVSK